MQRGDRLGKPPCNSFINVVGVCFKFFSGIRLNIARSLNWPGGKEVNGGNNELFVLLLVVIAKKLLILDNFSIQ